MGHSLITKDDFKVLDTMFESDRGFKVSRLIPSHEDYNYFSDEVLGVSDSEVYAKKDLLVHIISAYLYTFDPGPKPFSSIINYVNNAVDVGDITPSNYSLSRFIQVSSSPLSDMPMFLKDETSIGSYSPPLVAKWRLEIGK